MYRIIAIVIGVVFLAYGLLRIGVGSAMLGHELGIFEIDALQEPIEEVGQFLEEKADNGKQLIPVTVGGYVGYIALMGLTLSIGAIGSLFNKRFGLPLIATFLLMYAALFVNFQTINPKIVHLAVAAVLFLLLFWLKKRDDTPAST
jgi:hypothetical protein